MRGNEVEVVRAFCRFAVESRSPTALVANVVCGAVSEVEARSMVAAGRTLAKLEQGLVAAAIATPNGPVLVERAGVQGAITVTGPGVAPVSTNGTSQHDLARALFDALVAAGGPVEDAPEPTEAEADRIVARLQAGERRIETRGVVVAWSRERGCWLVTSAEDEHAAAGAEDWSRLRFVLDRLLAW